MSAQEKQPRPAASNDALRSSLQFALDLIKEERSTLLALAIVLTRQIGPDDHEDTDNFEHTTAWRLAQVLEDRLSCTSIETALEQVFLNASNREGNTQ